MQGYQVYVGIGEGPFPQFKGKNVVLHADAPFTAESVAAVVEQSSLTPSDVRSKVAAVIDESAPVVEVLALYTALLGFSRRRIDAIFGSSAVVLNDIDVRLRSVADAGRPEAPADLLVVGASHPVFESVSLSDGMTADLVSAIRYAHRVLLVCPDSSAQALPMLLAVAALRARDSLDKFPLLTTVEGFAQVVPVSDPAELPDTVVDLAAVRAASEDLRRTLRGDTRDALVPAVEPSDRDVRLVAASVVDVEDTLVRLGATYVDGEVDGEQVKLWHCLKPWRHTHGDATPSARVLFDTNPVSPEVPVALFRCYRCLHEKVDSLGLVMWATGLSPDESADWILSGAAKVPAWAPVVVASRSRAQQ